MTVQRIACIGECMIELSDIGDSCYKRSFAGDTLNTAVYMSRSVQGSAIEVSYITALGTDAISEAMLNHWQQEDIQCDQVVQIEAKTPGLYAIAVDETGERSFSYWRSDSAAKQMFTPQGLTEEQKTSLCQNFNILYLSGITLAILDESSREILFSLLEKARTNGAKVAFDSNYRPKLWNSREEAQAVNQRILSMTDIAMVTYDDEQLLFGDTALEQTMTRFTQVPEVVIKNGADGCILITNENEETIPSTVVSNVVDTTSAGDSFNGAYLAARLQSLSPRKSALRAHRMAGAVIQYKGAIIPKAVTEQLIKNN